MKKIASLLVAALLLAALAMVGMAEEEQSHVLIAYYSRTGTTQEAAERIAELTGGDLVKLETVQAYPEDYTETTEVAKAELERPPGAFDRHREHGRLRHHLSGLPDLVALRADGD